MHVMQQMELSERDKLSHRLRVDTLDAHREAEKATFVQELMGARLPVEGYTRLVAQQHAIYSALEAAVAANTDAALAPFLDPALNRLAALERDLEHLAGEDWAREYPRLPATRAYVDRIDVFCTTSSVALLAHHYIRYLGDLSGGQVIGRILRRTYGFGDDRGTEFYSFPEIASPKRFKDRYREQLDALDWNDDQRTAMLDEVNTTYRLNTDVFEALANAMTPPRPKK